MASSWQLSQTLSISFQLEEITTKKYHISTMTDSDDEPITLSLHALAALQNLEMKRRRGWKNLSPCTSNRKINLMSKRNKNNKITIDDFKEDWQLSQFWYSDETAKHWAKLY